MVWKDQQEFNSQGHSHQPGMVRKSWVCSDSSTAPTNSKASGWANTCAPPSAVSLLRRTSGRTEEVNEHSAQQPPKMFAVFKDPVSQVSHSHSTDEAAFWPRSSVAKAYVLFICSPLQPSCGPFFSYHLVPFPGCASTEATAAPSKRLFELNAWMPVLVKGEEVIWIWETEKALISEANRWIHLDSQSVNIYWVFIR